METSRSALAGRRVLITGGHGLLGSAVAGAMLGAGADVALLSRQAHPEGEGPPGRPGIQESCRELQADVCDPVAVAVAYADAAPEVVIHLAGVAAVGQAALAPREAVISSVTGTVNVLEEARSAGVGAVLVASSDKAYGASDRLPYTEEMPLRPKFPYEAAKAAADVVARSYWHSYGLPVAVVRSANLYGPGDRNRSRLVPGTVAAILAGSSPVVRSDGSPERDYLFVADAARAYVALAEALLAGHGAGEPFNVGSGVPRTALEVVGRLLEIDGGELRATVEGEGVPSGEIARQCLDWSKLAALTGWSPRTGLDEGLAQTLAWYRDHPAALAS